MADTATTTPAHHAGRPRRLLRAAALAAGVGLPVAALAVVVRSEVGPIVAFDEAAIRAATDLGRSDPALYDALIAWQTAFQAKWVNLVVSLVCLWVWRRHGLRTRALWAFITLLVTWNLGLGAKYLVQRARPVVEDALTRAPGYSFPSGHAMNAASAGVVLLVLVWPLLGRTGRIAITSAVVAAVALTGVDRVMLGAHYPSDVVAGIALGGAMAGAAYLGFSGLHPAAPDAAGSPDTAGSPDGARPPGAAQPPHPAPSPAVTHAPAAKHGG